MARKKADPAAKLPLPEQEDIYRRDHLCFVMMSLVHYIQDLKADAETDPKAGEVVHAMGTVSAWLNPRIYEAQERSKKGLPPGRSRPSE